MTSNAKSRRVSTNYNLGQPVVFSVPPNPSSSSGNQGGRRSAVTQMPNGSQLPQQNPPQAANGQRQSTSSKPVRPPDRHQETIETKTNMRLQAAAAGKPPEQSRQRSRSFVTKEFAKYLAEETSKVSSPPRRLFSSVGATNGAPMAALAQFDQVPAALPSTASQPQLGVSKSKSNKSQPDSVYDVIRSQTSLIQLPARSRGGFGSFNSNEYGSGRSSTSSMPMVLSDQNLQSNGAGYEFNEYSLRWQIDAVGRMPGQLRSPKGVCILRNSGSVVVADSKNARLQIFNGSSGKLVSVLGAESDDQRVATTFRNVSHRRMEPRGLCEVPDGTLLVATDLNRVLFIDAEAKHGGLAGNLVIQGKTQLSGIAVTANNKLILTEFDSAKPSVGIYENNGILIRAFKADFRTPEYVALNQEYEIVATSDGEQQNVLLFDISGKLLNRFGQPRAGARGTSSSSSGIVPAPLGYPAGICWLDSNRLLVADRSDHRVVAIDIRNFAFEEVLNDSVDGLNNPVAIATNQRNRIVLLEEFYDFGVNEARLKMFRLMSSEHF